MSNYAAFVNSGYDSFAAFTSLVQSIPKDMFVFSIVKAVLQFVQVGV
jgi:hypothetical protein